MQDNLRKYDKEILQDLWKVRTGIHEIRESHRRQLEAESRYLTATSSSLGSQRRPSEAESQSPVSPTSPFSPTSTSHVGSGYSVSKFNFKEPTPSSGVKKNDDAVLESFFGTESMTKLNTVLWQSSETEEKQHSLYQKSQSTDRLDSAVLPPLPEKKKRTNVHPLSVSPKASRVHASSPDISSMRRGNQPVSDVCSDMQQLRMRLRETANQTVAEIEEKFSPTLSRLTLGPAINLSSDHTPTGNHSHQGSLDSSTNNVPMLAQASISARHGRQHSLPLSTVARTRPRSPTSNGITSPPKSPSKHHAYSNSISPPSRSPTPPHHNRQYSLGSGPNVSGLITTHYQQNNPYEVPLSSKPQQPSHYPPSTGQQASFNGTPSVPHRKSLPLTTRQYSPSNQSGRTGGVHVSEQPGYGNRSSAAHVGSQHRSNLDSTFGGRFYASNPNLLSAGYQESTHYSTAVIKKRRNKNTPTASEAPRRLSNEHNSRKYEPQHFDRQSSNGRYKQPPHPAGQVTSSQYDKLSYQPEYNYHNQRRTLSSSGESSQSSLEQIQPYMSTGDLRASMRQYQYVPYAEQKKSITSVGRDQPRQIYPEHTWL